MATSRISLDLTGAIKRSWTVEDTAGIGQYQIVKSGTDAEKQCKATTDNNDKPIGITISGNNVEKDVTVVENGGLIPVKCADAIADLNLPLYLDATDPTLVTDTVPSTTGTYYSIGKSKSKTSASDEYVMVFVDIQKLVVA